MREVFIHQDSARVGLYKSILDEAGIANFVRNGLTSNSVTDMPSPVFFPALCVMNDADYDAALALLRPVHHPEPSNASDWKCAACGEEVPGNFDTCWKCGAEHSPASDASSSVEPATPAVKESANLPDQHVRTVANVFRWLLIVDALYILISKYVLPAMGVEIILPAGGEVKKYFQEHSPSEQSRQWIASVSIFREPLYFMGVVLCFCFSRYGRFCLALVLLYDLVEPLGYEQAICAPGWYVIGSIHRYCFGILLAMMYLPPLSGFFARKAE